jgi:hypothetical protein
VLTYGDIGVEVNVVVPFPIGKLGMTIERNAVSSGSIRQHTSAYLTSAHVSILIGKLGMRIERNAVSSSSIRQHTSTYLSIPQHTSAYLSIPQHSISQHTLHMS